MRDDLADDLYNPELPDSELLCGAARKGKLKECAELLLQGALVNKKNSAGRTPLYLAAVAGHVEICRLLVAHGADVRKRFPGGETPLNFALRETGSTAMEILRILFRADTQIPGDKLDWHSPSNAYLTPFQYAVRRGATDNIALLIDEFGEDPAQVTLDGVALVDLTTNPAAKELLMAAIAERRTRAAVGDAALKLEDGQDGTGSPQRVHVSPVFGAL